MKDWRILIQWLWNAWRGNRTQAVMNAVLGLFGVGLSLASVKAMQNAIDIATGGGKWLMPVLLMAGLILCEFAVSMLKIWVRNILGIKAKNTMQQRMLSRLLRSEWRGRESMHSGDVMNRLETDVDMVINFLTETLPNTLSTVTMFVGAFCYLYSMDFTLALITVGILPFFILLSRIYISRMRRYTREVRDSDSKVQSTLQETVQNRMLIKTMQGEDLMLGRLEGQQSVLRNQVKRRTIFSLLSNLTLNLGFSLGYLIAFGWCIVRLADHTLTYGGMSAFLQLVFRIQAPARDITKLAPAFVQVFTAAERLMALEEVPLEQSAYATATTLQNPKREACGIRLENVTYRYPDGERDIVKGMTFDFAPGTATAIMGETGAGKTTLIRMILALLKPTSGTVYIYNNMCREQLTPEHREELIYVPQGNTLLSGSIRENLKVGCPTATEAEMKAALHEACADFVLDLPEGLDTQCTEKGGGLSEGQAQRICIARALLRPGSILLLDEATSALDCDTEELLLHSLMADNKKRTFIFVTHRPAVLKYCQRQLQL